MVAQGRRSDALAQRQGRLREFVTADAHKAQWDDVGVFERREYYARIESVAVRLRRVQHYRYSDGGGHTLAEDPDADPLRFTYSDCGVRPAFAYVRPSDCVFFHLSFPSADAPDAYIGFRTGPANGPNDVLAALTARNGGLSELEGVPLSVTVTGDSMQVTVPVTVRDPVSDRTVEAQLAPSQSETVFGADAPRQNRTDTTALNSVSEVLRYHAAGGQESAPWVSGVTVGRDVNGSQTTVTVDAGCVRATFSEVTWTDRGDALRRAFGGDKGDGCEAELALARHAYETDPESVVAVDESGVWAVRDPGSDGQRWR